MAFDLEALPGLVDQFAELKSVDLDEFKARIKTMRSEAKTLGVLDTFSDWLKQVGHRARTAEHRAKVKASGLGIDTGTDPDIARVVVSMLTAGSVRPGINGGRLHCYDGAGVYEPWSDADLACKVMTLDGAPHFDDRGKPQHLNMGRRRVGDVIATVKSSLHGAVAVGGLGRGDGWFGKAPKGIMFRNCFLAVDGSAVVAEPINPDQRATVRHDFRYDPDQAAPRFEAYIKAMLTPGQIPAMQELLGAALFGVGPKYQRAGFVRGKPGTGKSTLVKVLKGLMPDGSVTSSEPGDWDKPQFAAQLHGVLLNGVEELRNTHFGDVNTLKSVIVGDQMTVKVVFKPVFAFRPAATHIIASNEWPRTANSDRAFWDRWLVFDLKGKRFRGSVEQVRDFDQVLLREELPGIIAWVVEGMRRLACNGRYTEIGDGAEEEWKGEANSIAIFTRECLRFIGEVGVEISTHKPRVYQHYKHWCVECGYQPLGRNKFYSALLREDDVETCGRMGASFNVLIPLRPIQWRGTG